MEPNGRPAGSSHWPWFPVCPRCQQDCWDTRNGICRNLSSGCSEGEAPAILHSCLQNMLPHGPGSEETTGENQEEKEKKKKLPIVGCRLHVLRKRLFRCRISQFYSSPSTAAPTWSCNQPQDGLQQPQNGGQRRAVPSPLLVVSCAGDEPRWCCTGN